MNIPTSKIAGIDYGSKLAGTTVIAFMNECGKVEFATSIKNKDADQFILEWTTIHAPELIFLDAPLSLPGVYQHLPNYNDYFFRVADKAVHAMSPLFLGGLTARAMQLQANLEKMNVKIIEVYPGYLAKILALNNLFYKKEKAHIPALLTQLSQSFDRSFAESLSLQVCSSLSTWHHFDALLALFSGMRYLHHQHLTFGEAAEGLILV